MVSNMPMLWSLVASAEGGQARSELIVQMRWIGRTQAGSLGELCH